MLEEIGTGGVSSNIKIEDHEDGNDDKGGRVCDDYWHQVDHIECEYKEACEYRFF